MKNCKRQTVVLHNPIQTHNFKIRSCQKCDFQINQTTDFHKIGMIQIQHTPVSGFGLILIKHMLIFYNFTWAYSLFIYQYENENENENESFRSFLYGLKETRD